MDLINFSSKGVCSGVREVLPIKRGFTAKENNSDRGTRILMAVMIKYYHDTGPYLMKTWRFKVARLDFFEGIPPKFEH